jgi:beta-lactam-binding protein with PASTA domain
MTGAGRAEAAPGRSTNNDGAVHVGGRVAALGAAALVVACLLTSCGGSSPTAAQKKAVRGILSTTSTTTTTTTTTVAPTSTAVTAPTTARPQITVPNVIGLKIAAARAALRAAGFASVSLTTPCNKGTLASQSVVSSRAIPGTAPDVRVGAVPLSPGATVTTGTPIGITWSGCFGDTATVPAVTGLTFASAKHALHAAGLTWACYSVDVATTTTSGASTTSHPPVTTTVKAAQPVVTQTPAAGTVLRPGATVSLTMHHCPQ